MNITTRGAAIADNQRNYFTGKPCSKGHVSYRYTCSSNCHECSQPDKAMRALKAPKPLGKRTKRRITISFAVADEFIKVFQEVVLTMSHEKDSRLELHNVNLTSHRGKRSKTDKDLRIYKFKVFPEDLTAVETLAANFYELWRHEDNPVPRVPINISTRAKKWITLRAKQK